MGGVAAVAAAAEEEPAASRGRPKPEPERDMSARLRQATEDAAPVLTSNHRAEMSYYGHETTPAEAARLTLLVERLQQQMNAGDIAGAVSTYLETYIPSGRQPTRLERNEARQAVLRSAQKGLF